MRPGCRQLHNCGATPADTKLAARASEVALDCGQFQAAERAAARWRALTPNEPAALHAAMRAELGLYKIDDARGDFQDWIKSGGLANARAAGKDDTASAGVAEAVQQLAQEAGVPATLAMLRGVQDRALQSGASQLVLADLALDGWNYREAVQYGEKRSQQRRAGGAGAAAAGAGARRPRRGRSGAGRRHCGAQCRAQGTGICQLPMC